MKNIAISVVSSGYCHWLKSTANHPVAAGKWGISRTLQW